MKRILLVLPVALAFLPKLAVAQGGLVACTGIDCGTCEFAATVQLVFRFLITIGSIVATIALVYVGLRLAVSAGSTEVKQQVKTVLWNIIIGLVLIIAAYAIVNVIMRAILPGDSPIFPWDEVPCIYAITPQEDRETPGQSPVGASPPPNVPLTPGNCAPETFTAQGFTQSEANTMSCIAGAESGCMSNAANPRSSAYGILQITRGWPDDCHGLNLPECSAAVGVTGNLNCYQHFSGGNPKPGHEAEAELCNQAAANDSCNRRAARCLLRAERPGVSPGYHHWTDYGNHRAQQACVDRYGG